MVVNVIHCCPQDLPERVFEQLVISTRKSSSILTPDSDMNTSEDQQQGQGSLGPILSENGWIAVYGPYLNDDGTYKSKADEEVGPSLTTQFPPASSTIRPTRLTTLYSLLPRCFTFFLPVEQTEALVGPDPG